MAYGGLPLRSGGSLPSLKPGEILGAGALADRGCLSALAGGGAFGSVTQVPRPRSDDPPIATALRMGNNA
jgi:hypothetical protein